jgi:hypothetical protein
MARSKSTNDREARARPSPECRLAEAVEAQARKRRQDLHANRNLVHLEAYRATRQQAKREADREEIRVVLQELVQRNEAGELSGLLAYVTMNKASPGKTGVGALTPGTDAAIAAAARLSRYVMADDEEHEGCPL